MDQHADQLDPVAIAAEACRLSRRVSDQLRGEIPDLLYGRPQGLTLLAERLDKGEIASAFMAGSLRNLVVEIDDRIASTATEEVEVQEHHGPDGEVHTVIDRHRILSPAGERLAAAASDLRRLVEVLDRLHDLQRARRLVAERSW